MKKNVKNRLWEDMTVLGGGKRRLETKINITLIGGNNILNTFHLIIFLKKKTIFSKIAGKNNIGGGGVIIFDGKGCPTTKINLTFSMGNWLPNTVIKFSP